MPDSPPSEPDQADVASGSKADLTDREPDFRFTPESRLIADIVRCPFRADFVEKVCGCAG